MSERETDSEKDRQTGGRMQKDRVSSHIVLFGSSPEVGSSCVTGDVQHSDALQTGQRDRPPVTLTTNHCEDETGKSDRK